MKTDTNFFDVICIEDYKSLSGAKFIKNKKYKCKKIDEKYYIYNNNNITLKFGYNPSNRHFGFHRFFITLQDNRKLKLKKLNEINL